jgi:EAL domain-containing protein (putative c-di-GMP-specific phosphodiesterase class I)
MHPSRGLVAPAEFIPIAEDRGIIHAIGRWVLETACVQLVAWARDSAMAGLVLSINVSARELREPKFVDQVFEVLARTGADPTRLKIELTESVLLDNVDSSIAKMQRLKAHGIGLALDDFGTGYASLSYLKRLPLDQLKIDRSFVHDMVTDPHDAAITRTIADLGKNLGITVVAEGVETEAQRDQLIACGCQLFQGYLFGQPAPLAVLIQMAMSK